MTKKFNGPFGSYDPGTGGAVLNACVRQEGRPLNAVEDYVLSGDGTLLARHGSTRVVATYVWEGDEIVFNWKTA